MGDWRDEWHVVAGHRYLLGCTTIVSLWTKDPAWRTAFRALIVALVGSSLCVFDGWLEIDGWQRGELCSILGGVFLLGLGHLAWSREGEQRDDAASVSLLLGSLLVTVPLACLLYTSPSPRD